MKKTVLCAVFLAVLAGAPAQAQDLYYTKEGFGACDSEAQLDKFLTFAQQKDLEAMANLVVSGRCVLLRAGIPVYRESLGFKSGTTGKIKVRPKGDTMSLWTTAQAVEKK